MPKRETPTYPPALIAELIALRAYIEHILLAGRCDPSYSREDLEDDVQLVFLKVIGALGAFRPENGGLKPFLAQITRNVKVDAFRSASQNASAVTLDPEIATTVNESPERSAQLLALSRRMRDVIDKMPPPLRAVMDCVDIEDVADQCVEYEIVAQKLNITPAAAKMRLSRARAYLRENIKTPEDYYSVPASIPSFHATTNPARLSLLRRALTFLGHFVHLWPPLLLLFHMPAPLETMTATSNEVTFVHEVTVSHRSTPMEATPAPTAVRNIPVVVRKPQSRPHSSARPAHRELDSALRRSAGDGRTVTNGR